jgi:hypothetical protein
MELISDSTNLNPGDGCSMLYWKVSICLPDCTASQPGVPQWYILIVYYSVMAVCKYYNESCPEQLWSDFGMYSEYWLIAAGCHEFIEADSSVGIATGCRLGNWGVRVWVLVGSRIFPSPCHPDWPWGPPSLLSKGYLGVKRPEREADQRYVSRLDRLRIGEGGKSNQGQANIEMK